MADNYRPHYGGQPPPPGVGDYSLPPPPMGPPPPAGAPLHLPPRPPPTQHGAVPPMYHFGAPPQQPGSSQATQFSFQAPNINVSSYPLQPPTGPSGHRRNQRGEDPKRFSRREGPAQRSHYQRVATSDRPLLRVRRGATPDQLAGMVAENGAEKRFLDLDDVSDSSDEAMEQSMDEEESAASDQEESNLPATKKQRIDPQPQANCDGVSAKPKWSNPEPYTALPPPNQSQRKKRDVVKLIRKARVVSEKMKEKPTQVETNDDFISLDTKDDQSSLKQLRTLENDAIAARFLQFPGSSEVPNAGSGFPHSNGHKHPSDNLSDRMTQGDSTLVNMLSADRKRKRSVELEDTVMLKQPNFKHTSKRFPGGSVLDDWRVEARDVNPIPWQTGSHSFAERPGFRWVEFAKGLSMSANSCSLHKEICDFYNFVKPRSFEAQMRSDLIARLQEAVKTWKPECVLHSFGSYAAGLYLPNADMDVVVISPQFLDTRVPYIGRKADLSGLAKHLCKQKIAIGNSLELIPKAKVPIVKFRDQATDLRVDLSFDNLTGVVANQTFHEWKAQFPAMPIIATTIKQFLLMRGMNEVVNGGLGGFSVTCLVTSLLQNMPRVQTGELVPEQNLGDILLEFLDFYGNRFDYTRTALSMDPPCFVEKVRLRFVPPIARIDPHPPC